MPMPNENTLAVSIKIKLTQLSSEDTASLSRTTEQYRQACNFVSQYIFDHDFELNQRTLQKVLYQDIRSKFNLKSQFAISTIKTTVARYKTVQTQMKQKPYRYKDINTGKWYRQVKDLAWLRKPLHFAKPQADLVRNRDWSYLKNGQLSINTVDDRIKCDFVCPTYFRQYLTNDWKLGGAKLLNRQGTWYLHVSATKPQPEFKTTTLMHVVGLDRGLRFLATSYDEKGRTKFYSGQQIMRRRAKYRQLRAQLQSKGTKSAKRRLKKIGQRENRWMSDVNHCLSKTLIDRYGQGTLFVLEDLTNVSFNRDDLARPLRSSNSSWAFFQLEQYLTYKTHLVDSEVITVAADYTSQRCPKCGRIVKTNRDHAHHLYHCRNCGYQSNDDRIGAMNIQLLGTQYVSSTKQPKFSKITTNE